VFLLDSNSMKITRTRTGVEISLDWEECKQLMKHLETIGWHKPVTREMLSQIDEIIGRNNDHEDDCN